jgi:hypothetical protein
MSPFKQKLEQLKLSGGVPLPPPNPGQVAAMTPAAVIAALDPQPTPPEAPALELKPVNNGGEVIAEGVPEPKRRGRPPGARNKAATPPAAAAPEPSGLAEFTGEQVAEAMIACAEAEAGALPPIDDNVTLKTLARVAANLGVRIVVRFGA